jgi:hypothetical protein
MNLITIGIVAGLYLLVGAVYAAASLYYRWYLVEHESQGRATKALAIVVAMAAYCLLAWPLPAWQESRLRWRSRRG